MATYEMTFYLSNFIGARTIVQEDEYGNKEVGIFIPAERNGLIKAKQDKWLTWGLVQEMDIPMFGFSHRVIHKTNPEHVRRLIEQGIEPPFIARMKPTRFYHRKPKFIDNKVKIDNDIDI